MCFRDAVCQCAGRNATPSNSTWVSRAVAALLQIIGHPIAAPFAEPVPPEVPMYYNIIEKPMDLGTILTNLQAGKYTGPQELYADTNLVWANCRKYNEPDSEIAVAAKQLEGAWKQLCPLQELQRLTAATDSQEAAPGAPAQPQQQQHQQQPLPPQQQPVPFDALAAQQQQQQYALHEQQQQQPQQHMQLRVAQLHPHAMAQMSPHAQIDHTHAHAHGGMEAQQALAQMQAMAAVIAKLRTFDVAGPFLQPVSRDVPGYYKQITHPIDLGTIWTKMSQGQYPTASHAHADIMCMFKNCYSFNLEGSEVYICAQQLSGIYHRVCQEAGLM